MLNSDLFLKKSYKTKKHKLLYRLLLPIKKRNQKKYPLVLFLHGAGERGTDNELQLKYITDLFLNENNRKNFPCIVLAPQCPPEPSWWSYTNWTKPKLPEKISIELNLVIKLLNEIIKKYPVDKNRIYVFGLSMGGCATYELIMRYPNKFAAALPICGWGDTSKVELIKHIPLWIFHGALDDVVNVKHSRKMFKELKKIGGLVQYTEYLNIKHNSWIYAFKEPDFLKWLFEKKRRRKR